jgi:hypothetical protein
VSRLWRQSRAIEEIAAKIRPHVQLRAARGLGQTLSALEIDAAKAARFGP